MMNKKIDTSNEKVRRIIGAAYEEFAKYGEEKASLNKILKSAKISKGVFYHYFQDKEALFEFLVFFMNTRLIEEMDRDMDWENSDIVKRVCEITKYKLDLMKEYPYMLQFYYAFENKMSQMRDGGIVNTWREKFYGHNIDFMHLGGNTKEKLNIIRWTYKGMVTEALEKSKKSGEDLDIDNLKNQCDEYLAVFRMTFTKDS